MLRNVPSEFLISLSELTSRSERSLDSEARLAIKKWVETHSQLVKPKAKARRYGCTAAELSIGQFSAAEYIKEVDFTGRELHPGKRGKIEANEPLRASTQVIVAL